MGCKDIFSLFQELGGYLFYTLILSCPESVMRQKYILTGEVTSRSGAWISAPPPPRQEINQTVHILVFARPTLGDLTW